MKKNLINKSHLEGYLYEHDLEIKVTGEKSKNPNTEYITGTISIATDENMLNVVSVHFSYVTELTKKGTVNNTFTVLKNIIDGVAFTAMEHGKDKANKIRVDSALDLNEFWTEKDGKEEFVSARRNEGGFVHFVDVLTENENDRNTFDCDVLVTGAHRVEANEEKGIPEKVILKGAAFNYAKALLPMEFSVTAPDGMDYFESLEPSAKSPVFTRIQGVQISTSTVTKKELPSAFGGTKVVETKSSYKDFVVTWASPEPYEWDTEATLTVSELNEAITNREILLATKKKEREDYKNQKTASVKPAASAFNF